MFGMLRTIFTLLICILIVGFFLGWFTPKTTRDPVTNQENISISVDKKKMDSDLQTIEHKVAERIQNINNQPQGNTPTQPSGRQPAAPGMSFGPINIQPSGQGVQPGGDQPASVPWPIGPTAMQPSGPMEPSNGQPASQPQIRLQTPDFQFTVPLGPPPPGDGR
jgi:hypothetical protein